MKAQQAIPTPLRPCIDLCNADPVRIRYARGTGDHLVISFASIGLRRNQMPPDEFTGTLLRDRDQHCLFVSDISRSWMNDPTVIAATRESVLRLVERHAITRITTLGLSMGAFSALVGPCLFPVTTAIAISPQYSMSRRIMPGETRWDFWRKRIADFRFETAEAGPAPQRAFVFHGLLNDTAQMRAFGRHAHVDHFVFPEASHSDLGQRFKQAGILSDLVRAASLHDRKTVARLVRSCGGMWRARFEGDAQERLNAA